MLEPCAPGAGSGWVWHIQLFTVALLPGLRYAIDRSTDTERIFDIDANTGAIVTGKVLDRETAGWHNITVLAMEAGEQECWGADRVLGQCGCLHCRGDQDTSVN